MIQFQIIKDHILIAGDTFPVKDQIKAIGGRFDWQEKYWKLPHTEENLKKVKELCSEGSTPTPETEIETDSAAPNKENQTPSSTVLSQRPAGRDTYTISQISSLVTKAVERALPNYIWVTGEVQNLSRKTGPRGTAVYLSLAEPKEDSTRGGSYSLQAAVWADRHTSIQKKHGADTTAAVFQEGLQVRIRCKVTIYKDRGSISLQVSDIDPAFTQGALALARQKTIAELRRLKLDRKQKQQTFDLWADSIGLITAEKSRAYGDFVDQYESGGGIHKVYFWSASSQGEATRHSVIAGIQTLSDKGAKAIVITRGGGSAADLRWFDDLELCKAICNADVPIFAAFGHHDDVCVAEEVCFQRMKTPTAAAVYFVQNAEELKTRVNQQRIDLASSASKTLTMCNQRLSAQRSFFTKYSTSVLALVKQRLDQIWQNTAQLTNRSLDHHMQKKNQMARQLFQASQNSLQRGQIEIQRLRTSLAEVDPAHG